MGAADDNYLPPEQKARQRIDAMLADAGWVVQDYKAVNLYAAMGVAVRELVTNAGPVDYVLFVNCQAVGVIEAKKKGTTLSGVEWQMVKYQANVPDALPAFLIDERLPYGYESTGDETWFTCRMDPEPTVRRVFSFHRPETFEQHFEDHIGGRGGTLRARIPWMPEVEEDPARLRQAQFEAITNLERSLKDNHLRALIQMATGSGKTFAAANICERLIDVGHVQPIQLLGDWGTSARHRPKDNRIDSRTPRFADRPAAPSAPGDTIQATTIRHGDRSRHPATPTVGRQLLQCRRLERTNPRPGLDTDT